MIKKREEPQALSVVTQGYAETLATLKKQIQEAQVKAALAVNKELIKLYWAIGKTIVEKQETVGWGSSIIERLAKDLQRAFPGIEGFSKRNVFRMRAFYLAYQKMPQAVAQVARLPFSTMPLRYSAGGN